MSLTGSRAPSWRFLLLNRDDVPIRELGEVVGGHCEVSAHQPLGGSASVILEESVDDPAEIPIDYLSHRMQAIYDPGTGDEPWPVGVWLFTSPKESFEDGFVRREVSMQTKLIVPSEATVDMGFAVPAGANIIDTVVDLLRGTGEERIAVTPSDAVMPSQRIFEEGESVLTVINELLSEVAGYWALWCDGNGLFRVEPYVLPADRPTAYVFPTGEGAPSIHSDGWARVQDMSSVPNVCKVLVEGTDDTPAIEGFASNTDPDSPFSIPNRGREIVLTVTGVEVAGQAEADLLAERRLLDSMSPIGKLSVTHAPLPLEQNQVVEFFGRRASVQRMKLQFEDGTLCDADWREI